MLVHVFNTSTLEAEAGGSLGFMPPWSTVLHSEFQTSKTSEKQKPNKQNMDIEVTILDLYPGSFTF